MVGFLCGENEDEKGSFLVILGFFKFDLNKEFWKNNFVIKYVFLWIL